MNDWTLAYRTHSLVISIIIIIIIIIILFNTFIDTMIRIKHLPLFNQTRLDVIDVTNECAIHPLYDPGVIVNRTKIMTVERP